MPEIGHAIEQIKKEMQEAGIWRSKTPEWVGNFNQTDKKVEKDFLDWFQFVYLPNLSAGTLDMVDGDRAYIVPQAMQFFGDDVNKGRLLRLLIELDAAV